MKQPRNLEKLALKAVELIDNIHNDPVAAHKAWAQLEARFPGGLSLNVIRGVSAACRAHVELANVAMYVPALLESA